MASLVLIVYNKILSFCCFVGKHSVTSAEKVQTSQTLWLLQREKQLFHLQRKSSAFPKMWVGSWWPDVDLTGESLSLF